MWQVIAAGLMFGFVSSFHCVGMCGPLVLALPVQALAAAKRFAAVTLYHAGRVLTYVVLGCVFAFAGHRIYLAGFQRILSVSAGAVMLVAVIWGAVLAKRGSAISFFPVSKSYITKLWGKTSLGNFVMLGVINGLLPCGMVYFALITSLSFSAAASGVLFMLCFGAGTLLLMVGLHYFGSGYLKASLRNNIRRFVPYFIAFAGVLMVFRGLSLGIPFISPRIATAPAQAISCH
jgi:sulfite exporter TauE/SafE